MILHAILRSNLPVPKRTIVSTNPNNILGGEALGKQYCEVVVNVVLKRDTVLPRPYDGVEIMADAYKMPGIDSRSAKKKGRPSFKEPLAKYED